MQRSSLKLALCLVLALVSLSTGRPRSQTTPVEGLRDNTPKTHALTNVRIVPEPGRVIEKGTIVLRDGTIEAVGLDIAVPADARVWDYDGMTVYAGLIEMYSHLGLKKEKKKSDGDSDTKSRKGAGYWNANITPERDLLATFEPGKKDLEKLRALGFACALVVPDKGIIGGAAALVNLGDASLNQRLVEAGVPQCINMVHKRRGFGNVEYPTSLMGRMALIRQALLDAQWYSAARQAYADNPAQARPRTPSPTPTDPA